MNLLKDFIEKNKKTTLDNLPEIIEEQHGKKILKMTSVLSDFMTQVHEEEKLIILIDIVGFSKSSTRDQVYKIYLFQSYLTKKILTNKIATSGKIHISHFVPTGDGCYIVADKCDENSALKFLISIVSGFRKIENKDKIELSIRASALIGKVVPFFDMARHFNYIGEGMNEASRILSGGQNILEKEFLKENPDQAGKEKLFSRNSLYLGDSLVSSLENFTESYSQLYKFENVPDKHGLTRNITVLQGIL